MKLSNCCGAEIIDETDICSKCKEHCEPEVYDFIPINTARIIGLTKEDYMQNEEKKEEEDELMEKTIEEQNLAYEAGYKEGIENHLEREVIKEMIATEPNDWIDKVMEFVKYKVDASVWDKEDEEDLRLMLTQQKEAIEEGKVELLEEYTKFLFDHGYVDDDVFNEEPTPDKEFLNKLDK